VGGTCLQYLSLGLKLGPSGVATAPGYPAYHFFAFGMYLMYISIFLHMLTYKDIEKLMFLRPRVPAPPVAVSWGS
jgi:hypothetical protein